MDYMKMVKEAVEHENFLAKQEAVRKAHELEMAMRKALERFNEIKDDVALLIQVIREIEDVCKNKTNEQRFGFATRYCPFIRRRYGEICR